MERNNNILIIEEDQQMADFLQNTLKAVGYNTFVVSDPREGLDLMRKSNFSSVITELRCAKMNGVSVVKEASRISDKINVIVITAYSFITSAIEALEAGAFCYITKPLNSSEVRIAVERAIERSMFLSGNEDKDVLIDLALKDGLTGVFNRRYFNELVSLEFNRLKRSPAAFSLLMLDIDNFKKYNDTYGHQKGDQLLRDAAKIFKNAVRLTDVVCRYGGEEFVILLPKTGVGEAKIIAERVRMQFSLYLPTTISIGISSVPEDACEPEELIKKADSALYEAKSSGKNKFCTAS